MTCMPVSASKSVVYHPHCSMAARKKTKLSGLGLDPDVGFNLQDNKDFIYKKKTHYGIIGVVK